MRRVPFHFLWSPPGSSLTCHSPANARRSRGEWVLTVTVRRFCFSGYDSDPLDAELKVEGVEMVAPHRKNRKRRKTQDGRPLRRYARRWKVERFFAWLQWQRRIVTRWEYYPNNFLGFVQLASLLILFKRF